MVVDKSFKNMCTIKNIIKVCIADMTIKSVAILEKWWA